MAEWQSIETAPRDGTRVLLFGVANEVPSIPPLIAEGYWHPSSGMHSPGLWRLTHAVGPSFCPTYWTQLPPAPQQQAEGG